KEPGSLKTSCAPVRRSKNVKTASIRSWLGSMLSTQRPSGDAVRLKPLLNWLSPNGDGVSCRVAGSRMEYAYRPVVGSAEGRAGGGEGTTNGGAGGMARTGGPRGATGGAAPRGATGASCCCGVT